MAFLATSISPNTGNAGGGETVHITGTQLDTTTAVTIGGNAATFEIINAFLVRAIVPAHAAGAVSVVVTDGTTPTTLAAAYTFSAVNAAEQLVSTLARKWKLDVNTGSIAVPVWTPVRAVGELKPTMDTNLEEDSDYDSEGYGSEVKTELKWGIEVKILRKIGVTSSTYDLGQETLRTAADAFGSAGTPQVRWYDRDGGPEAYSGFASVSWEPEGGDTKALDTVTVKLSGNGKRTAITNPAA